MDSFGEGGVKREVQASRRILPIGLCRAVEERDIPQRNWRAMGQSNGASHQARISTPF